VLTCWTGHRSAKPSAVSTWAWSSQIFRGSQTHLTGADDAQEVFETILENLIGVLPAHAILVLVMAARRRPRTSRRPLSIMRVGSRVAGLFANDST
jgi:hypothetical protein